MYYLVWSLEAIKKAVLTYWDYTSRFYSNVYRVLFVFNNSHISFFLFIKIHVEL